MRRILLPLMCALMCAGAAFADEKDGLSVEYAKATDVAALKKDNDHQATQIREMKQQIETLTTEIGNLKQAIETMGENVSRNSEGLATTANDLGTRIGSTETSMKENEAAARNRLMWIIIGLALALVISIVIFVVLRRRVAAGNKIMAGMQEKQVELDDKIAGMLEQQLQLAEKVKGGNGETDHSLVLTVANEMMRIQQNLAHMDESTRGVRQLRNRAAAIQAELERKGYEVPALVGTEYKEGMTMEVTMEDDDTIEPGKMIIRRVNRPAVLFGGKMIQPADVVVAYNPA